VVNLGFVGAFGNYKVGDNIFVEEAVYHDFNLTAFGYKHGEVPNIKEDLKPDFNYYKKLKDYFRGSKLYTGDSFQESKIDDNFIVDMEATALFHVCFLLGLKIVSIKTVSDVIGLNSNLEEYKNFEEVGSKNIFELYNKIEELLK
jgi:adenosylhomocysteine nucleosidase